MSRKLRPRLGGRAILHIKEVVLGTEIWTVVGLETQSHVPVFDLDKAHAKDGLATRLNPGHQREFTAERLIEWLDKITLKFALGRDNEV